MGEQRDQFVLLPAPDTVPTAVHRAGAISKIRNTHGVSPAPY